MNYSERHGHIPPREAIQHESMDDALRNRLWNVYQAIVVKEVDETIRWIRHSEKWWPFFRDLWDRLFKKPVDEIPGDIEFGLKKVREWYFSASWHQVYSFVEFVHRELPTDRLMNRYRALCDRALEEEMSGHRFVGDEIAPFTMEQEIVAIEAARKDSAAVATVNAHLMNALDLLADRGEDRDYRNSIKESISAVEALCWKIVGTKGWLKNNFTSRSRDRAPVCNSTPEGYRAVLGEARPFPPEVPFRRWGISAV